MKIKVDEDLPGQVVDLFREKGYRTDSVIDQDMAGWKDSDLWRVIQAESRFLVTADKGFADIRTYPPGSHPGVMLIRPDQDGIRPIVELVERVLQEYSIDRLAGKTSVVTPRGIRVRRGA